MSRPGRIALYSALGLAGLLIVLAIGAVVLVHSAWFHDKVRERIVFELEKATGGRAELGSYSLDWRDLRATVDNLVLHGKESPDRAPLFRASSITVGLKIVSLWKRDIDIALLAVQHPEVHIYVAPDGATNLPSPKTPSAGNKDVMQTLFNLKVGEFSLTNGVLEYDSRKIPLDLRGEDLNAKFYYRPSGPQYQGTISSRRLQVLSSQAAPLDFDFDTALSVEKDRVRITSAHLGMKNSSLELSGLVTDLASPRADLNINANVSLAELGPPLKLSVSPQGEIDFQGKASASLAGFEYAVTGKASGRGLGFRTASMHLEGMAFKTDIEYTPDRVVLSDLSASALGATFRGHAAMEHLSVFQIDGSLKDLSAATAVRTVLRKPFPWAAIASGPVKLSGEIAGSGVRDLRFDSSLTIVPGRGGIPVNGLIQAAYNQRAGILRFGDSHIATPASSLELSGTLGKTMQIKARSSNLNDVLPVMELASGKPPQALPMMLEGGVASFDGTVQGALKSPTVSGKAAIGKFRVNGVTVDRASADFDLSPSGVTLRSFELQQGPTVVSGNGNARLFDWHLTDNSAILASLNIRNAQIEPLLAQAGYKAPLSGVASVTANLKGTYGSPQATAQIQADQVVVYGENLGRVRAGLRYTPKSVELTSLQFALAQSTIQLSGAYRWTGSVKDGEIQFHAAAQRLGLAKVGILAKARPGLDGTLDFNASGSARLAAGVIKPETLNGRLALHGLSFNKQPLGNFDLDAVTHDAVLQVTANGDLRNTKIGGSGSVHLSGDYQSEAKLQFAEVNFDTLRDLASGGPAVRAPLPFAGSLEGNASFAGPLMKPGDLHGQLTISKVEVRARPEGRVHFNAQSSDLVLRNAEPVVVQFSARRVHIVQARLTAKDTTLEASGNLAFDSKSPWNMRVRGGVNLAILQVFDPDLLGKGNATINATIQGSLASPDVSGRLQLQNASLYMSDLSNGIDRADGVILFDQNRASIQSLTAELGGGKISLTGFVGFGGTEAHLLYHLQGKADHVRIRYQGMSVTLNTAVNLTGTSASSLVTGTVTVARASFNPRTDLGSMLAQYTQSTPVSSGTPSEYLRGMQLDIQIENSQGLELQTSLARNIQVEIDLRLRGTPAKPVLLGQVSVTEGEIEVFGNKYDINRGQIRFLNPVKIEPYFDMDLETKARGIDVNISFSGTLSRLNVTYRSDPPLQSNEIIALLAVGRDPNSAPGLAESQVTAQSSFLQSGANTLLGAALSSQVSGRLQRLFGVSRVKIDPQLTGVDNIPQARLTLEQQVSRNITVTYVTNLTRTDEQIVQIQWDINRRWSAVAIRDENGVFGIDFQYRKSFK